MTCRCHLCEPWNIMAEECSDAERLNELQQQRLAVHGLTPRAVDWTNNPLERERRFLPPSPPVRLSDFPAGETLWREHEEERLRLYLLEHMERARGHERTAATGADAPEG